MREWALCFVSKCVCEYQSVFVNTATFYFFKYNHKRDWLNIDSILVEISYLQHLDGNYFCICEDDITFDNIKYINNDLNNIILNAPEFDILLITKIYSLKLEELYTKWIPGIFGTACYIVSKKGLEKFLSHSSYNFNNNSFNIIHPISCADHYIYNYVDTFVYKYNFIATLDKTSLIHQHHLKIHKRSSFFQLYNIINN
jgi:GR25 family glycosyltransferase involved in LPS biosynthesis